MENSPPPPTFPPVTDGPFRTNSAEEIDDLERRFLSFTAELRALRRKAALAGETISAGDVLVSIGRAADVAGRPKETFRKNADRKGLLVRPEGDGRVYVRRRDILRVYPDADLSKLK